MKLTQTQIWIGVAVLVAIIILWNWKKWFGNDTATTTTTDTGTGTGGRFYKPLNGQVEWNFNGVETYGNVQKLFGNLTPSFSSLKSQDIVSVSGVSTQGNKFNYRGKVIDSGGTYYNNEGTSNQKTYWLRVSIIPGTLVHPAEESISGGATGIVKLIR